GLGAGEGGVEGGLALLQQPGGHGDGGLAERPGGDDHELRHGMVLQGRGGKGGRPAPAAARTAGNLFTPNAAAVEEILRKNRCFPAKMQLTTAAAASTLAFLTCCKPHSHSVFHRGKVMAKKHTAKSGKATATKSKATAAKTTHKGAGIGGPKAGK